MSSPSPPARPPTPVSGPGKGWFAANLVTLVGAVLLGYGVIFSGFHAYSYLLFPVLLVGFGIFHFTTQFTARRVFWGQFPGDLVFQPFGRGHKIALACSGAAAGISALYWWLSWDAGAHPQMFPIYARHVLVIAQVLFGGVLYYATLEAGRGATIRVVMRAGTPRESVEFTPSPATRQGITRLALGLLGMIVILALLGYLLPEMAGFIESNPLRGESRVSTILLTPFSLVGLVAPPVAATWASACVYREITGQLRRASRLDLALPLSTRITFAQVKALVE